MEGNVDLMTYFLLLKRRAVVVVLTVLVALGGAGVYTFVLATPQYTANTVLFVWQNRTTDTTGTGMTYNDLLFYDKLVSDYRELCKSRTVASLVAAKMGLPESMAVEIATKIDVTTKSNTRLLMITVTDPDPGFAANMANSTAAVFQEVVVEKMGAENVQVIDAAMTPDSPASPNKPMNMLIALIVGLAGGVGLAFLIDFLDSTVKTIEEIETITGMNLLGVIPEFESET